MKTSILNVMAMSSAALIATSIAQLKFSGIYAGVATPNEKVVLAITKGGRILGLGNSSKGLRDALDPARSTINAAGKLKAVTGDGETIINGTVSPDFKLRGTGKSGGDTFRITAARTFN